MRNPKFLLSPIYQLLILILCLYAISVFAITAATELDPQIVQVLEYADYAVCAIYFTDFLLSLWHAENRTRYLITWGWLDFLSSIPALNVANWGRVARAARFFRVLRGLRATKLLATTILRHRAENSILAASLAAILLVVFCSIAVLHFETGEGSNIKTAEDAIWWSLTTITTVGYGDRYPVTTEGRFVAILLMGAGVGLFSTFSGYLAASFMSPKPNATESDIVLLRREIAELKELLEQKQTARSEVRIAKAA